MGEVVPIVDRDYVTVMLEVEIPYVVVRKLSSGYDPEGERQKMVEFVEGIPFSATLHCGAETGVE